MPAMFTIRKEQVEAYRASLFEDFEHRAAAHLRKVFPDATAVLGEERLTRRVRDGVGRAARYGLTAERHVMAFLHAGFLAGAEFDTDPSGDWARTLLNNPNLGNDDKAKLLLLAAATRTQRVAPSPIAVLEQE